MNQTIDKEILKKIKKNRVRTPTVLQMEAVECGAAALAIILAHYGRYEPLEKLRLDCGVSRDGSKAGNIVRAATKYGLIAQGYRREIKELGEDSVPFIAFWNFNHFIVIEGITEKCVYINDPASGPRKISLEEFNKSFTGVIITFKTGPDFKKGGEKPSIYKSLHRRLKGSRLELLYVLITGLCLVLPGFIIPIFTKTFVDDYLIYKMDYIIGPLVSGIIVTALIRGVLIWLQSYSLLRLKAKLSLSDSSQFLWHVLRLPVEFFNQRYAGDISSRVSINDRVATLLSRQLTGSILNAIMVIFYLYILLSYSVFLTSIGIFIVFLNILALKLISRKRVDGNKSLQQDRGKLTGTSISGINMIETLKASGTENDFFSKWAGYFAKVVNREQELNTYSQFLSVIPSFLSSLNNIAILYFGSFMVMKGTMSAGSLVAYQSLMGFFITPINNLVNLGSTLQEVESDLNRLDDVLKYETDSRTGKINNQEEDTFKLKGKVELKNITFGYSPVSPPLIENFNLTLNPGSRVALVGTSGSGKSTIGKIICGLYKPWSGEILFDGTGVDEIEPRVLHNSLAMVDQSIMLFEGTIKENISMWDNTMDEENIVKAAIDSSIHDDITAREKGYESFIEEGGRNFSGGQAQRIEIARSLSINPTILVLDEATSALDSLTEEIIDRNLRKRGCTQIIIAHRLSTIKDCDEIIVLKSGQVIQRGTHEKLKDLEGPYRELIQLY
mgnify:CR=1 FL=1